MSYLRNHLRHFVIPGIRALARSSNAVTEQELIPYRKRIPPSAKCKTPEIGMVHTMVASVLPKTDNDREELLTHLQLLGTPDSTRFIDTCGRISQELNVFPGMTGGDVMHSLLLNTVRTLRRITKRRQTTIVLPGRDVWCWELLGKKLGLTTAYDPRLSRPVSGNLAALKKVLADLPVPDWRNVIVWDTGYYGSIPEAILQATGNEGRLLMLSAANDAENRQIYPNHTKTRKKALTFEYVPKYHTHAKVVADEPQQFLATLREFVRAATFTLWLWTHRSPRKVPTWREALKPRPKPAQLRGNWAPQKYLPIVRSLATTGSNSIADLIQTDSSATTLTPTTIFGSGGTGVAWLPVQHYFSTASDSITNITTDTI